MTTLRHPKLTYGIAFALGALVAFLIAAPARSAEPLRLDRIGVVRFSAEAEGSLRRDSAILFLDGRVHPRGSSVVPRPANTPASALNRNLVSVAAWHSYQALGTGAVSNFTVLDSLHVGTEEFLLVAPLDGAAPTGRLLNLSARLHISNTTPGIAGFVIDERPRTVLIRAVGPTLQKFGIGSPAPDPFLSLKRNGLTLYYNGDWNDAPDAAAIRDAAVRVGAFPLDEGSRDAARLLVLDPGVYTIAVEPTLTWYVDDTITPAAHSGAGEVLLEIYSVPPDVPEIQNEAR